MRNSEIVLCIDFQGNSAMISLAFEKDYSLIGKQLLGGWRSKIRENYTAVCKKEFGRISDKYVKANEEINIPKTLQPYQINTYNH